MFFHFLPSIVLLAPLPSSGHLCTASSLFPCPPVESLFGPLISGTTVVCHGKSKIKKTSRFPFYLVVMLHHVMPRKNENETDKKMTIQVAELFFSLLLRRKHSRRSYYYRKDEWFIKKLVINRRQPVTGVLHILHSWSVNKIGKANYSKSLIHTDSRNILDQSRVGRKFSCLRPSLIRSGTRDHKWKVVTLY